MEDLHKAHTPIKNWAEDDQPREKMLANGSASLSKSELLAILINHGTRSRSAIELAKDLLLACNSNLHQLAKMTLADIQKIKGIGPAKAVTIKAAIELGIRKEADRISFRKTIIRNSEDIVGFLQPIMQDAPTECCIAIFLNQGQRVIDTSIFSVGGLTGTVVDVRTIGRRAIELGATGVVVSHNHPSGNTKPSKADIKLTENLKKGLSTIEINLLDHIIISDEGYHSFADNGGL
jgi:DNA repair protein RadC